VGRLQALLDYQLIKQKAKSSTGSLDY
jgi:hypothetical protein